jgi:hypothetical protein
MPLDLILASFQGLLDLYSLDLYRKNTPWNYDATGLRYLACKLQCQELRLNLVCSIYHVNVCKIDINHPPTPVVKIGTPRDHLI